MLTGRQLLWGWALVGVFLVVLEWVVPIVIDEAYLIAWGLTPSPGYYDHPPLLGWVSALLVAIENRLGWLPHGTLHRLAWILLGAGTGVWIQHFLRRRFAQTDAAGLVLAFAALPVVLVFFGMFNNDALLAVAGLFFLVETDSALRAGNRPARLGHAMLAGLGLGAALMTKYLAGLFAIAMMLTLLTDRRLRAFLFGPFLLTLFVGGVLFLPNLIWNLYNCNVNLAFNFGFRDMAPGLRGGWIYALMMLLILGPVLWFPWRGIRRQVAGGWQGIGFFTRFMLVLLGVTLLVAFSRGTYRLNWGMPYAVLALPAMAEMLSAAQVRRLVRANLIFLVVVLAPILSLFVLDRFGFDPARKLVIPSELGTVHLDLDLADGSLIEALAPFTDSGRIVAAVTYGQGAQLDLAGIEAVVFPLRRNLAVFGRNFDLFTDYQALDGRDFILIGDQPDRARALAEKVFERIGVVEITANHATYTAYLGDGFDFDAYRRTMILPFMRSHYDRYPFGARACFMDRYRLSSGG